MKRNWSSLITSNPRSGRTWPSWPKVCRPQLQTPPVLLGPAGGAEHSIRWWVRHPDYCHEVENGVSHLLLGGALPHHRGDGVQSAGAAAREFPKAGHSCRKTGLLDHARLRELFWARGFGQGRWKHQHRINFHLFSSAGPADDWTNISHCLYSCSMNLFLSTILYIEKKKENIT